MRHKNSSIHSNSVKDEKNNQYQCDICKKSFARKSNLIRHKNSSLHSEQANDSPQEKEKYKCEFCEYKTYIFDALNKHIDIIHLKLSKEHKTCTVCSTTFTSQHGLNLHLHTRHQVEKNLKTYRCSICNFSTVRKSDFYHHLETHNGNAKHQCNVCNGMYKSKRLLQTHHRRIHEVREDRICSYCKKHFGRPSVLKEHIEVEHFGNLYKCEICDKTFKQKDYLKRHKNTHEGNVNYKCEICEKYFSDALGLKRHQKAHGANLKVQQCGICDKEFETTLGLKFHQKTVHGANLDPKQCEMCDKKFKSTPGLKYHQQTAHSYEISKAQTISYT